MSCRRRRLKNPDDIQSIKTVHRDNGKHSGNFSPDGTTTSRVPSTNAESDEKVVKWWRSHQQEGDVGSSNDFVRKREQAILESKANMHEEELDDETLVDAIAPSTTISPFTNALENSQLRTQERPYDISHEEFPINPQNGMVLEPRLLPKVSKNGRAASENPSLGVFITRGRSDLDDGTNQIEFFQPQIVPTSRAKQQKWQSHSQNSKSSAPPQMREKLATEYIGDREKGEKASDGWFSAIAVKNKESDDQSPLQRRKKVKKSKKLSLSKFIARKSEASLLRTKAANVTESSDHLSDVHIDVDSITRERYLLACQMLKMSIIQKESALIPIEKEYVLSLLDDFESHSVDGTDINEEHVNSIERAVLQLENDSISMPPHDAANIDLPSPSTAARAQTTRKSGEVVRAQTTLPSRNDKNPHTATRKPKKFMKHISNPCNPIKAAKFFGRERDIPHEDDEVIKNDAVSENTGYPSHDDTGRLVRFDGWSFQNSIEYPFSILDADGDGDDMNPRVFTPSMMEALRGFMPMKVMDHNFWLRFSLARDGASFATLLASVRASTFTMIGIETDHGEVFGSFTGRSWRIGSKWYGTSETFLWRLKQKRYTSPSNSRKPNFEREIEIYPCTENDDLIQYCTGKTIAVGGGEWQYNTCPYSNSGQGIGLVIDGDLAGGETNSCATFSNPQLARHASSSNEFVISNLEVWSLTPCTNVEDATKMEMRDFFNKGYEV
jgi:hypothetical protein